jgi:hypothetical protein
LPGSTSKGLVSGVAICSILFPHKNLAYRATERLTQARKGAQIHVVCRASVQAIDQVFGNLGYLGQSPERQALSSGDLALAC